MGEVVTGLLYVEPEATDLCERMSVTKTPLNALNEAELCPGSKALEKVNAELR
jgi:2-oxoglutarate ferredoxin oxidoreductase subunit beta